MPGVEHAEGRDMTSGMGRPRTYAKGKCSVSFLKGRGGRQATPDQMIQGEDKWETAQKQRNGQHVPPLCEMKSISHRLIFKISSLK